MGGFESDPDLMKRLGKHKTGKSCLYIKKLADVEALPGWRADVWKTPYATGNGEMVEDVLNKPVYKKGGGTVFRVPTTGSVIIG